MEAKSKRIYKFITVVLIVGLVSCSFYTFISSRFNAYSNLCLYSPDDIFEVNQATWNTSKGRLFQATGVQTQTENILAYKHMNILGSHFFFILLFISLFYIILPHVSAFIIIQCLLFALSSVGLYLVAREIISEKKILPLLILLIYTVYYPLTCLSYFIHPENFSMFFMFFTLYFYLRGNLKFTLIFSVLSIFCREENALIVAILGILSYFQPTKKKYFLPLTLLGVLSFIFIKWVLFSRVFPSPGLDHFERNYGYLGNTSLEKVKNILFHPSVVFNNITQAGKLTLLKDVFGPLLYLPFLSPLFLAPGLIGLLEILLTSSSYTGSLRWQPWYLCFAIPFIFVALAAVFDKIYNFDKLLANIFPKRKFFHRETSRRLIKAFSAILICLLFLNIYTRNAKLTHANNNRFRDYFAVDRYWYPDVFRVISAIKNDAKVVCPYKIIVPLSSRQHIAALRQHVDKIVEKGAYDIILISEDDWFSNLDKYNLLKNSPLYQEVYYTPYIQVFTRKEPNLLIDNWKFDLIAKVKSSSISHNYIFSDFIDYSSVLESAGVSAPSQIVDDIYRNKKIHYGELNPLRKFEFRPGERMEYFVSDKSLDAGFSYLFVFAAKANNDIGMAFVKTPADNPKQHTEIKLDAKTRLFVIPFKMTESQQSPQFSIQTNNYCSVMKPILIKAPARNSQGGIEPILQVKVAGHIISYNPWLNQDTRIKKEKGCQFLTSDYGIYRNPLILFMKLLRLKIPLDLYKYSWKSKYDGFSEIFAVRY